MENLSEKTATELFELIYLMPKDKIKKIPQEFLEVLHKKKSKMWKVINSPDEVNVKNLSSETKNYLAYIYLNYILDGNEKESYKEILEENEKRYQEKVSEKYDISKKLAKKANKLKNKKEVSIAIKKEESILSKFIIKIKSLFKKLQF